MPSASMSADAICVRANRTRKFFWSPLRNCGWRPNTAAWWRTHQPVSRRPARASYCEPSATPPQASTVLIAVVNRHIPATPASGNRLRGCVLRHSVDLGIAIDFGGLLNAQSAQATPVQLLDAIIPSSSSPGFARRAAHEAGTGLGPEQVVLAMFLVERVSWRIKMVTSFASLIRGWLPQAGVAGMWRFTAAIST
jgi:hypothetical protein